ncbi:MAG: LON peptidase substrate-binding domain-containing protein [Pseudomonadota bacterium]
MNAFDIDELVGGLPDSIAIFPLEGALVLPRGNLPLNIFEPRYLEMIRDAMASTRMIGMIQPREDGELYGIGGLGKINQFTETDDGRFMIVLSGISRFRVVRELDATTAYRQAEIDLDPFLDDFRQPIPLDATTRVSLEEGLKGYLDAQGLSADWESVKQADDESLVNTLAGVCPFDPAEKQALLEAADLPRRAATLEALMRFAGDAAAPGSDQVH